jgi:hypothetical protein
MVLSGPPRILHCDVPVLSAREVFRRALWIDFDPSTPTPTPSSPLHPGHSPLHPGRSLAGRDHVGVGVPGSGCTQPEGEP